MYQSPIETYEQIVSSNFAEKFDDLVLEQIKKLGVVVDKEELIKALEYDRDQYQKGYKDGRASIICCEDCEYFRHPFDNVNTPRYCCLGRHNGSHDPNWFCGDAKRKEDA